MKTTFKHIDLNDSVNDFMNHLNNNMDKPDGYSYELNTRGSKYFKVEMNTRGSRSVYCFINKRNGEILKAAGSWFSSYCRFIQTFRLEWWMVI